MTIQLTKSETLFIRACKSKEPRVRLRTLRNRLYLRDNDDKFVVAQLGSILIELCEKLKLLSLTQLVHEMRDVNSRIQINNTVSGNDTPWQNVNECILSAALYAIRFASSEELANFRPPLPFRK